MENNQEMLDRIRSVLAEVKDPESGRSIGSSKQIHDVVVTDNQIDVKVGLTSFAWILKQDFHNSCVELLSRYFADMKINVEVVEHHRPAQPKGQVGLTAKAG